MVPQVVLFGGRVLVAPDPVTGIGQEAGAIPRFLLQGVLVAGLFGGIASLIAAWTPRRAYATAMIIAFLIIPPIIVGLVANLTSQNLARFLVVVSPADILEGTNAAIFGSVPDSPTVAALGLSGWIYLLAAAVGIMGSITLTIRRYLRIAA